MTRATFDLHLAGEPTAVVQAVGELADRLSETGHFLDHAFEYLHDEGRPTGLRLRTTAAARAALDLLPVIGCYTIDDSEPAKAREVLRFTDGVEIETGGPLRIHEERDGLYVVGEGFLIPVESRDEAKEILAAHQQRDEQEIPFSKWES